MGNPPYFVGAADTFFYSFFFILYYLKRTTRGVPRCERSEQWGFRRGWGVWGVARSAVRGGPGFPENELVKFLGVHGWGPTIFVGVADTGFYSLFFILYSLLFKTDDPRGSPLRTE